MKSLVRYVAALAVAAAATFPLCAQTPYSYAPSELMQEEGSALGGNKNQYVQGMVLFDPASDPALARMKGQQILGVRCNLRAAYRQARNKRSAILAATGSVGNIVRTTYVDFEAGWNEVLFEEPFVIGDEAIYLGVQVYETIGTALPLMAYAKANVPHACIINQGKKSWTDYSDHGTLLIAALVDDEAAPSFQQTAYVQNTTHPQAVAPDADFPGGLYIHNFSSQPLQSLDIDILGQGATQPLRRTIPLAEPVPAQGSVVVQATLHSGPEEGTAATWTATAARINGADAQPGRPGTTPLFVTLDDFQRVPLVEEFTSQRCINCPQMAYFLHKAFDDYEGEVVYITHHSGFAKDAFTNAADLAVVYVFGGYENEYNPAIMYNRAVFEGESTIVQGIRDMSPQPYLDALAVASAMPAMAEVRIEVGQEEVRVYGRVARDLRETPLYLSCYLVEDGISTDNYPQLGMDDADAPADLKEVFRHNGVILHHFNTQPAGDLLTVSATGAYDVSFPAVKREGFGGTERRIVAFVHRMNTAELRDNEVLNAAQVYLTQTAVETPRTIVRPTTLFDLGGRPVAPRNLRPGIYLQGGRKVVR